MAAAQCRSGKLRKTIDERFVFFVKLHVMRRTVAQMHRGCRVETGASQYRKGDGLLPIAYVQIKPPEPNRFESRKT
jgi:hypothetical protein